YVLSFFFFFFFQAEDGIRDGHVTGVQTCALPISDAHRPERLPADRSRVGCRTPACRQRGPARRRVPRRPRQDDGPEDRPQRRYEIGRASCRERVESMGVAVTVKKKRKEQQKREYV